MFGKAETLQFSLLYSSQARQHCNPLSSKVYLNASEHDTSFNNWINIFVSQISLRIEKVWFGFVSKACIAGLHFYNTPVVNFLISTSYFRLGMRIRILSAVNSMGLFTSFGIVLFFAKRVVVLKPAHVVISVCCFSLTVFPFSMFPANLSPRFDQGEDGQGYEHNKGNGCTDDSHQAVGFHGNNLKKNRALTI